MPAKPVVEKEKSSWLIIAEKVVLPILGFLCIWIFNTINVLEDEYSKLSDKNLHERILELEKREEAIDEKFKEMSAMWRVIKSYDDKITANKVQSQVNALVHARLTTTSTVESSVLPNPSKSWKPLPLPHILKPVDNKELILNKFKLDLDKDPEQFKQKHLREFNQEQLERKR